LESEIANGINALSFLPSEIRGVKGAMHNMQMLKASTHECGKNQFHLPVRRMLSSAN
jgi:hypothetical protein